MQVSDLRVRIRWPRLSYPRWHFTAEPQLLSLKHESPHCPAISLELLPKVFLLSSGHPPYLEILRPELMCPLNRASSFSRLGRCSPVLISALPMAQNIRRASPRITTSCAWLPKTMLHEAMAYPITSAFQIQKKDSLIRSTSVMRPIKGTGYLPQLSTTGPYAKGVLILFYCKGVFSFLTPSIITLLSCKQLQGVPASRFPNLSLFSFRSFKLSYHSKL